MREVSAGQFRRLAGADLAQRTDQILDNADLGAALYRSDNAKFVISFGNRFADLPYRYPPSNHGDSVLDGYLLPEPPVKDMVSPLVKGLRDRPAQIAAPPRQPPRTVYPEIRTQGY